MNIDGLILESRHPEYQFLIKGPMQKVWRDGFPVDEQKILILQFDRFICFTDDMIREQEWTEEDKEFCGRGLEQILGDPKQRAMWIHEPKKPPLPWPTYDDTPSKQIHTIAQATGMINEAIAYESSGREGGARPEVLKNLQVLAQAAEAETITDEELDEMTAV